MLRVHLLQQWYSHSDSAMEEALIRVTTMRGVNGIVLINDRIPDETTITPSSPRLQSCCRVKRKSSTATPAAKASA
jgi:IS5 family transposase